MSNFLVPVRNKIVKVLRKGTNQGKVDKINNLTRSLTQNTDLIAGKYKELLTIEKDVNEKLDSIKEESFEREIAEINKLHLLPKEEQENFTKSLMLIKDQAIEELGPIGEQAQRIKAHMLVTLNKANHQKVILLAKSKLAGNASLQLETLKTVSKQTVNVNRDLKQLLDQLDEFNQNALNSNTNFKKDVRNFIEESTVESEAVVDHVMSKLTPQAEE